MVPVRPPEELLLEGLLSYAVIDKSGMRYQYRPYLYASSYWLWDDCTQVGRRDSLYWHQLLPLDHFFRGRNRLNASPGEYRLVVSLQLPRFHEDLDARSEWFTLSDTAVFVLRLDRRLVRDLRPYLGILSAGLWNGFGYEEAAGVERTLRTLDARPSHLDTSFPYLSFVSPRARARALRVQDAIAEAQKFVEDHPRTALAEELEFDLLGLLEEPAFQGKLGPPDVARLQSKADSLRAALLRTYPGNMRAASMMMRGNAGK
jgi:hypothetical protein